MSLAADFPQLSKSQIVQALGASRMGWYPDRRQRSRSRPRHPHPRRLTDREVKTVLDTLNQPQYCDLTPRVVYAELQRQGRVLASVPTFYRLLRAQGQSGERRRQRPPQRHPLPILRATAPNQVWTWDISKLPTIERGAFLNLYLILDLYSRYIVGWMLSRKENAALATHLLIEVLHTHQIPSDSLILHQDRGAPMTAVAYQQDLTRRGVALSHSRPRVSDDNPYSEAHFKTLKYTHDYPGRFTSRQHASEWITRFVTRYHHTPHTGLAGFTPSEVFQGQVETVRAQRQNALDQHFHEYPLRYPRGRPIVKLPAEAVCINPCSLPPQTAAELLSRKRELFQPNQLNPDHVVI